MILAVHHPPTFLLILNKPVVSVRLGVVVGEEYRRIETTLNGYLFQYTLAQQVIESCPVADNNLYLVNDSHFGQWLRLICHVQDDAVVAILANVFQFNVNLSTIDVERNIASRVTP